MDFNFESPRSASGLLSGQDLIGERPDLTLPVRFYKRPVYMAFESKEAGRPIHKEEVYVEIIHVGGDTTDRKARETDKRKYRYQYEAFQRGETEAVHGTRLEDWPVLSVAQVADMKAMKIFSVEQLAELPDTGIQKIMGGFDLRSKAKRFIEAAQDGAVLEKYASKIEDLENKLADLEKKQEVKQKSVKSKVSK